MSFRQNFFQQFRNLPYITYETLKNSAKNYQIRQNTLNEYIKRALLKEELISLKQGIYVSAPFFESHKGNTSYYFYLANVLLAPSYISCESALQYYGLIPEAIRTVQISVTTRLTRQYKNQLGLFSYRHIVDSLFQEYNTVEKDFPFDIAKPYKAIFDYLYFTTHALQKKFDNDIFDELRIDIDELKKEDKRKLKKLLSHYTSQTFHV